METNFIVSSLLLGHQNAQYKRLVVVVKIMKYALTGRSYESFTTEWSPCRMKIKKKCESVPTPRSNFDSKMFTAIIALITRHGLGYAMCVGYILSRAKEEHFCYHVSFEPAGLQISKAFQTKFGQVSDSTANYFSTP